MSRFKNALPLHVFVRQQQVLQQYRLFLRYAKALPDKDLSKGIIQQVVDEFHRNSGIKDSTAIRTLVQEGNRNLERLKEMVPPELVKGVSNAPSSKTGNKKTWLEGGDENDKRGRVGSGWPWERSK